MKHCMKLNPVPFEMIRSGKKIYELRLYDEKRRLIRQGDEIEFTCTDDSIVEKLRAEVLALHCFKDFGELYASLPLEKCGYDRQELDKAAPSDMDKYYSKEKQAEYGVVGIEIRPI